MEILVFCRPALLIAMAAGSVLSIMCILADFDTVMKWIKRFAWFLLLEAFICFLVWVWSN